MKNTFYVQIVSCQSQYYWYARRIGDIFRVVPYDEKDFELDDGSKLIGMDDCKVVNSLEDVVSRI